MIPAYAEEYLNDAQENLGEAFDYAVNACDIDINDFFRDNVSGKTNIANYKFTKEEGTNTTA